MIAWGRDVAKGNDLASTDDARPEPHSYQFDPPFQNHFTIQVQREGLDLLTATVHVE